MKNKYFVGIDISKNENIATIKDLKAVKETFRFDNNYSGFNDLIRRVNQKDTVLCLESTAFYHLPLAFYLKDNGFKVKAFNPLLTKKMAKSNIRKTKTDKIDSNHLAWLGQLDEGYEFDESHTICQLKILCRHRLFLKKQIERLKKHLDSVRFREVIFQNDDINLISGIDKDSEDLIKVLEKKVFNVEQLILKMGREIPEIEYLDSIPGISPLLACQIYSEIGNIERFKKPKALVAFAGIDSSIAQSGESLDYSGKMSKRGSPYLRYYLFIAARAAIRCDTELKEYYLKKKKENKHFYVRLAAISRKLLLRINRVLKDKRCYMKK